MYKSEVNIHHEYLLLFVRTWQTTFFISKVFTTS